MRAERASKIAVAAWAVLAVVVESYYASPGWAALRLIAPLLVGAMALASMADRRTVAVVAAAPYAFPLALYLTTGQYHVHYTTAWLAAMLGVVLPDALKRPWHVPGRWAAALACWAGVVAITAPIVMLRAVDLRWELLTRSRLPHEALGGLTFQSLGWTGHVALLIVDGILWFDWLYSLEEGFFLRWVIAPFAGSAVLMAATSAYQMVFDINAVNPTVYARLLRATGTLFDANVAGAAAAFWTGVIVLFGLHRFGRRWWLVLPVVPLFWVAVWGSGSRTAFLAALLISASAALALVRAYAVQSPVDFPEKNLRIVPRATMEPGSRHGTDRRGRDWRGSQRPGLGPRTGAAGPLGVPARAASAARPRHQHPQQWRGPRRPLPPARLAQIHPVRPRPGAAVRVLRTPPRAACPLRQAGRGHNR